MEENRPIRVAQVMGMAMNGGVEACIINYYRNIDRTRVQFDFFVEDTSKIIRRDEIEKLGGKVVIIPPYKKPFKYIKTLKRLFKEGNYDIVHSNMNALSVFVLYAAKKAGVKIRIAHSHSTSNKKEWKKNIIKNILRPFSKVYATQYFACSELAGRWLFGNKTFDKGKVTIINNAIELEKFKFDQKIRNDMRRELGLENNYVIGHIGRFMEQKNHTFLVDIFNEVQKRRPDAKLLLLGDGPLYDEIVKKVEELGLNDKVVFEGVHAHAYKYYNAMDSFVLPSLYEGLPVVGIEAQANGLKCYLSSEMTKETKILDTTEFLPLSCGGAGWAEKITAEQEALEQAAVADGTQTALCQDRLQGYVTLSNSKYNIVTEAGKLYAMYDEYCNGGGYNLLIYTCLTEQQVRKFGLKDKVVIGHVGRFMEQKNQTFLLDIFYEYQKWEPNSVLLLVGDGPLREELEQKVNALQITEKVIFAGVHKHPERYYQAMDCFLLPSLYEGLGIVLLEAQACGLPCVASTEVPAEVNITGGVDFLPLDETAAYWAKHILRLDREADRSKPYNKIKNSVFDIRSEAKKLLGYYQTIYQD